MSTRHRLALPLITGLFAALITVTSPAGTPPAHAQSLTSVAPARILDTRPTGSTIDGQQLGAGALGAATTITLPVAGRAGVPGSGATAVAVNITAIAPTATSFITAFPSGTTRPNTSNLNLAAGRTLPNMAIVPLGTGGAIDLYNDAGSVQLAVDVMGWFGVTGDYTTVAPGRLLDTRANGVTIDGQQQAGGTFGATTTRTLPIAGRGGVPMAGVAAVAVNITAVNPSTTSFVTAFPSGTTRPTTSNLNLAAGRTLPNMAIVTLGTNGAIDLYNDAGTTHLLVDVMGWFAVGGDYTTVAPGRLLDTRANGVTVDGLQQAGGTFGAATTRTLPVAGRGGVPASGVAAVAVNITAVNPSTTSFVTAFPSGTTRPTTSNLNLATGRTLPNMAIVPLGANGAIDLYNDAGTTHLLVDVVGWFPPTPTPSTSIMNVRVDSNLHGGNAEDVGVSRNGQFAVFSTVANNMIPGDTNGVSDVFVTNLSTGAIERVSLSDTGAQLSGASFAPSISDDGRFVVFRSTGFTTANDGSQQTDAFRRDRQTGTTELLSIKPDGNQFDFATDDADVSGDGNVVALSTITAVATLATRGAFARIVNTATTVNANLAVANYAASAGNTVSISQDGDKVAFTKKFLAGGSNFSHVFRYDVSANTVTQMTHYEGSMTDEQGGTDVVLSDDGNAVLYRRNSTIALTLTLDGAQQIVATGIDSSLRFPRFAGSSKNVIFASNVALIAGDTNNHIDVYLRTNGTPATYSVLSLPTAPGTQANGSSLTPAMSANQSVVAFASSATNLATGVLGDVTNLLVRSNGSYTVASRAAAGVTTHSVAAEPTMSADGRYVVFTSSGTDVTTTDFDPTLDVYRYDRVTGTSVLVSVGVEVTAYRADVSDDGRRVVFVSPGPVPGALGMDNVTNTFDQVFVRDITAGTTTAVSQKASGVPSNQGNLNPRISGNGRFVVFQSFASDLVAGDTNANGDVFVRDLQTGAIERVSLTSTGAQATGANNDSEMAPDISFDGRYVTWMSTATNVVPGATTNDFRIYRRDRQTSQTQLVASGLNPSISDDGRFITFESFATDVVGGDTNGLRDVFVKDVVGGAVTRVSVATGDVQALGGISFDPQITGNGRWVVYQSHATNLVAGDTNGRADSFRYDRTTGVTVRVSVATNGTQGTGGNTFEPPAISESGRFVVFASSAAGLAPGDGNPGEFQVDIFLRDLG